MGNGYADNPKIHTIYAVRELLDFRVRLGQGVDGREQLRYLGNQSLT